MDFVAEDGSFSPALDTALTQGVAPDAQVFVMKVFGTNGGAKDSDYMAAIEDAILLGADSVNLSLGSGNPGTSRNSYAAYQAIMENIANSGTVVSISAGNSGNWFENTANQYPYAESNSWTTTGSPGSYTNSLGVASVDNVGGTGDYVEVAGKKLEVTGFDYGANAVTTKTEGETTTYSGYKLVVTIPIKPDTEYHGWADGANYYDTNSTANGSKADLEYGETGSRQKLELNDSPEAPVTGYTVSYAYKTGTKPDNADALLPSSSVHIEGQEYNLETTPSADGWTFTGWLDSSDKECTGKQNTGTVPVTYYGKREQKQRQANFIC